MTKALVTGATGFIGYHVAKVLEKKGIAVRALVREGSELSAFAAIDAEQVRGDLRDYGAVLRAERGCDEVYHVGADYRLWVRDPQTMYDVNVKGTVNVMRGALEAGVSKVVYTSTVGVLSQEKNGKPGNEATVARIEDMTGHYKRSKFLAEKEVLGFVEKGLNAVIVNPTAPIGAMDRKPTPTGKIIVDFLNGRMPAYLDTGLNFVDVEDVAEAHVSASESGVTGERYILGNANLTLKQFLGILAGLTGREPPRWRLPYWPVLCLARLSEGLSKVTRTRPAIPVDGVRMARHYMFFDCSKAVRDLGMAQNSVEMAARKAIEWYIGKGYVKRPLSGG
jgi:dihydroflavonol-4-reductase